jgi:hypothetical protein
MHVFGSCVGAAGRTAVRGCPSVTVGKDLPTQLAGYGSAFALSDAGRGTEEVRATAVAITIDRGRDIIIDSP